MINDVKVVPGLISIVVEDKGIIKKANVFFKEGLNLVIGKNGSGKTTLMKEIERQSDWVKSFEDFSKTFAAGEKVMLSYLGLAGTHIPMNSCFLIDDGSLDRLDRIKFETTLKALSDSKNQIVITLNSCVELPETKANIIDVESFD